MKQYLFGQWVGISFIHWLFGPPLGFYLATDPLAQWSFYQVTIALWVFLSSLILSFWTIYLLSCSSRAFASAIKPFRVLLLKAIHLAGQVTTLLIVVLGTVRLLSGLWPEGEFFRFPLTEGPTLMRINGICLDRCHSHRY